MSTDKRIISRNYTEGRPGLDMTPFFIVHTYNGAGRSLFNWFQNNNLGVSAHRARFKDGNGEEYVDLNNTSHGAGNWWANVRSINIEHQDDGNPSDSIRTNELYEQTAQDIAQIAFELGHKVLNESNIKPHWEFTFTGCPGGLDIDRIRRRSNEILQAKLAPIIPDWKKNAKDIGLRNYKIQKDVALYDISDNRIIKTYSKGTDIGVRYEYNGFLITEYSYNNTFDNGFKKEDLEFVENDNLYHIFKEDSEFTKLADKAEAFNIWYDSKADKVFFNNNDITSEFLTMATKLEEEITKLKEEVKNRDKTIENTLRELDNAKELNEIFQSRIRDLEAEIKQLKNPSGNNFNLLLFFYEFLKKFVGKNK